MKLLPLLVTLLLAVAPAAAQPSAQDQRAARSHYQKGAKHFNAKQYTKALIEYRAAYALVPRPELLFNIARALHEIGDEREALEHYRRYITEAPPSPVVEEAREFAAGLERGLAPPPEERPTAPAPVAPEPTPAPEPAAQPPLQTEPPGASTAPAVPVVETAPSRVRFGGFAGLSVSVFNSEGYDGGPRIGISLGGFASYAIGPSFALRLEAAYMQKGGGEDPDYEVPFHTDYVQAALLGELPIARVHLVAGPYAGVRVAEDTNFDGFNESLEAGLLVGAGIGFPVGRGDLTVDLRYGHGLTSVRTDEVGAHRIFMLALGYATRAPAPR